MESGIQLISLPKNLLKKRNEKIEQIKHWINRLETLTSLFYDRIEFINEAGDEEDVDGCQENYDKKLTVGRAGGKLTSTTEQLVDNHHRHQQHRQTTHSNDEYISSDNNIIIDDDYTTTAVIPRRTIECEHRFWKPIVSDDNDNQHKEYLESAISWNSTVVIPQCDASLPCNDSLKVDISSRSSGSSPVEDKKPGIFYLFIYLFVAPSFLIMFL
ncbi:unnamed protein product [Trichobilharzia regenti]|nr:unnamed protein product [Trichobilharzia regenti]